MKKIWFILLSLILLFTFGCSPTIIHKHYHYYPEGMGQADMHQSKDMHGGKKHDGKKHCGKKRGGMKHGDMKHDGKKKCAKKDCPKKKNGMQHGEMKHMSHGHQDNQDTEALETLFSE